MLNKFTLSLVVTGVLACTQFPAFGQTPQTAAQRLQQSIVVNGQSAQGVLVVQNGSIQSYTCASPQPYTTPDRASSGWACFDQASGEWLLHALPPQSQNTSQAAPLPNTAASQPAVVYGAPLPVYVAPAVVPAYGYYPYDYYAGFYPYGYYPYSYPYFAGAGFGFGFGYGFRGPAIGGRSFGGGSVVRAGGRIGGGRR